MKYFLLGLSIFAGMSAVMFGLAEIFKALAFEKETIQNIFLVVALLIMARPFGELTANVFNFKNIK